MEEFVRFCAYEGCGKEFTPRDKRQIYCCKQCREKAKNRPWTIPYKDTKNKERGCVREDCRFYMTFYGNNCTALQELYDDDYKCSFYKEKECETE